MAFFLGIAYVLAIGYMIIKPLSLSTVPVEYGASRRMLKSVNLSFFQKENPVLCQGFSNSKVPSD